MKEITLEEAEKLAKENQSIGYYIDYGNFTLNQSMNIISGEIRTIASISGNLKSPLS